MCWNFVFSADAVASSGEKKAGREEKEKGLEAFKTCGAEKVLIPLAAAAAMSEGEQTLSSVGHILTCGLENV